MLCVVLYTLCVLHFAVVLKHTLQLQRVLCCLVNLCVCFAMHNIAVAAYVTVVLHVATLKLVKCFYSFVKQFNTVLVRSVNSKINNNASVASACVSASVQHIICVVFFVILLQLFVKCYAN